LVVGGWWWVLCDFELNVHLTLRAERDVEMMQERAAALSSGAFANVRGN
jgi:hypothetical protein